MAIKRLAQTLGTMDYFVVGFGAMIGVGWLVVMDDWLQRGGPIGAMLGFFLALRCSCRWDMCIAGW